MIANPSSALLAGGTLTYIMVNGGINSLGSYDFTGDHWIDINIPLTSSTALTGQVQFALYPSLDMSGDYPYPWTATIYVDDIAFF